MKHSLNDVLHEAAGSAQLSVISPTSSVGDRLYAEVARNWSAQLALTVGKPSRCRHASCTIISPGDDCGLNASEVLYSALDAQERSEQVIILPTTFGPDEPLLSELSRQVVLFCRDPASYCNVLQAQSEALIGLSHDIMLCAPEKILSACDIRDESHLLLASETPFYALLQQLGSRFFFRNDAGKTRRVQPSSSVDILDMLERRLPIEGSYIANAIVRHLTDVDEIHTDRLPVALIGARCGKRVYFYECAQKTHAFTYHYCLRDYELVQFVA